VGDLSLIVSLIFLEDY